MRAQYKDSFARDLRGGNEWNLNRGHIENSGHNRGSRFGYHKGMNSIDRDNTYTQDKQRKMNNLQSHFDTVRYDSPSRV